MFESPIWMPTLTPQQFVKKFQALNSCVEACDWIGSAGYPDFSSAWRGCTFAQWMAWLAARMLGLDGARAVVAAARTIAHKGDPALARPTLDLAQAVLERRSKDVDGLLALAFDCADSALKPKLQNGPSLMAASLAAHTVAAFRKAEAMPEGKEKQKAIVKAAGRAADTLFHVIDGSTPEEQKKLPDVVRAAVNEQAMIRVWDKLPT